MAKPISNQVITQQPSKGLTTWITLGIGMLLCLSLLAVAIVLILSLIPLYISAKNNVNSVNYNTVSSPLTQNFGSSWSPSSGQNTVTNNAEITQSIINAYSLPANSISATGVSISSSRRRRQSDRKKRDLPSCSQGSSQTGIAITIVVVYPPGSSDTFKRSRYSLITSKLNSTSTTFSPTFKFSDGSSANIPLKPCSGPLPQGTGGTGNSTATCNACVTYINGGYTNFFLNGNTYVGYPGAGIFNGTCTRLCSRLYLHCNSNYGLCSNGNITRYNTCNVISKNMTCYGVAAYADYNGAVDGPPGPVAGCTGSNTYCCCVSS